MKNTKKEANLTIKKEIVSKVHKKVQKMIAKKVAACIVAGIIVSSGGFIALGETGNLPEQVQGWYNKTAGSIRTFLGIEEASEELTHLVSEVESKEFTGLEIEGLNHVWQNNRWEYVDPNDDTVAGFWNEKEGKYEHTADVLKGEWKGLFVSQSLKEVRNKLKEDKEWTAENWNNGETKIPLPFDPTKGGTVEEIKALSNFIRGSKTGTVMGIRDLPSETVIFSPLPFEDTGLSFGWSDINASFNIDKDSISLGFNFKKTSQCLILDNGYPDSPYNRPEYAGKGRPLFLGYPILEVNNDDVLSKTATAIINPFLKENYQVLISSNQKGGGPISFSFENLLRDEKGGFIFIAPSQSEVEEMRSAIEEEMERKTAEAEKQTLEENFKTSSLIEKSETAPVIEGLKLDKKTGFYFTKKVNDYGLEEDTKVGVWIDGFIGLSPELIDYFRSKSKGFKIPLPFKPEEGSKIEIIEERDSDMNYLLIKFLGKTTIYSPINGLCHDSHGNRSWSLEKGAYQGLNFDSNGETVLSITSKKIDYYPHKEEVLIGDKLGEVESNVLIEIDFNNFLKIDDNPVFILINE